MKLWKWISASPLRLLISAALIGVLLLVSWLYITKGINGVSNFFFWRAANKKQAQVEQQLKDAADAKQAQIDQTLRDLAAAKATLVEKIAAADAARKVFEDADKTSKEKVAALEAILSAPAVHTDPTGLTTDDLCARAKAANSNPGLIAALCAQ